MRISKSSSEPPNRSRKLRNFDLTVEEIKLIKLIRKMALSLEDIERRSSQPIRLEIYRKEIKILEEKLEEIRENTLLQ